MEDAQKYKDIMYWIAKNDDFKTRAYTGVFDDKEKYNYEF